MDRSSFCLAYREMCHASCLKRVIKRSHELCVVCAWSRTGPRPTNKLDISRAQLCVPEHRGRRTNHKRCPHYRWTPSNLDVNRKSPLPSFLFEPPSHLFLRLYNLFQRQLAAPGVRQVLWLYFTKPLLDRRLGLPWNRL
jgi:hypothetical protein